MVLLPPGSISERENRLAAGLKRIHRDQLAWTTSEVHVHLDGDAIVCVIEDPHFPVIEPHRRREIHDAFTACVADVTGREVQGPFEDSQPMPSTHVSVLRLAPTDLDERQSDR